MANRTYKRVSRESLWQQSCLHVPPCTETGIPVSVRWSQPVTLLLTFIVVLSYSISWGSIHSYSAFRRLWALCSRGAPCFAFLKPDVPGEWLHFDESTKGKSSRVRCLVCSKHKAWEQWELRFCKESGHCSEKKVTRVKNRKTDMRKRPFLMNNRRRALSTKKLRGARNYVKWEGLLRWRRLRIACQPIVRSRLGVHNGETPNNTFPEFLELERRYGVCLSWSNV